MMTNSDKSAALHASVALAHIDALMSQEAPKSARWNRCKGAIDAINRVVDMHRKEAFVGEDMANACKLWDASNDMILSMYPAEGP